MKIYNYHPETKEFLSEEFAREDPLESKIQGRSIYLLPAYSTFIECPKPQEDYAWCFNEERNNWFRVPDFRGQEAYSIYNGEGVIISGLGGIPLEYTSEKPDVDFPIWDGKKWVTDKMAEAAFLEAEKARKLKQIDASMPSIGEFVQLLLDKKILNAEDLPAEIQGAMVQRKAVIDK